MRSILLLITLIGLASAGYSQARKDESPHTSGFATVNGVKLNYLDWGGKGEIILFITGMGDTAHIYDWIAPKFTDKYRVIALTRRGFGESEKVVTGYDAATLSEDVRLFLDHLKIKRVHLIGHSAAGNELTAFGSKYPKRTLKLVYLDAAYDRHEVKELEESDPVPQPPPSDDPVERKIEDALFAAVLDYTPTYRKIKSPVLSFYAVFEDYAKFRRDAPPEKLKEGQAYIQKLVRPYQVRQIASLKRELPSARVIELTGTHHYFFRDPAKREEVVTTIRNFLEGK